MDLQLAGRVAIVTGGSSGIGRATLELFLAEGLDVAFCAREAERVERVRAELAERYGERVVAVPGDVRDAGAMAALAAAVAERFGRADILVCNAGTSRRGGFADLDDDAWRAELDLKFFGLIRPIRAFLPLLRAAADAGIVYVAAKLAKEPEPHLVSTSAARAGTVNLAKSLATEFAPEGIRVNSILLGPVYTDQTDRRRRARVAAGETLTPEAYRRELAADRKIPLGRLGEAEQVAAAIAFLASPLSGYTTGATLELSGGVTRGMF